MKTHIYTDRDGFLALENEWNDLLNRSITNMPFSSYQWHSLWWDAYAPGDLWLIAVRNDDDLLVGVASLFIADEPENGRVVHFVGCEDVTDYLDVLVDEAHSDMVYGALANVLFEARNTFDMIDLCNIPAESPTRTLLPELLQRCGAVDVELAVQEVCPVIPLPDSFDEYLKMIDKKQRKDIQRKMRLVNGQGDAIRWYIVNGTHDINQEVDKFLELMRASRSDKAEFLENEEHVRFFKSIVPAAHEAGWLQLNFLEVSGEPAAAYVNFDYGDRILVYNSGLDPSKAAALSPGIVLLAYNIEHAINEKRQYFDFLRGDEQYKYRMGGQDTEVFNLKCKVS